MKHFILGALGPYLRSLELKYISLAFAEKSLELSTLQRLLHSRAAEGESPRCEWCELLLTEDAAGVAANLCRTCEQEVCRASDKEKDLIAKWRRTMSIVCEDRHLAICKPLVRGLIQTRLESALIAGGEFIVKEPFREFEEMFKSVNFQLAEIERRIAFRRRVAETCGSRFQKAFLDHFVAAISTSDAAVANNEQSKQLQNDQAVSDAISFQANPLERKRKMRRLMPKAEALKFTQATFLKLIAECGAFAMQRRIGRWLESRTFLETCEASMRLSIDLSTLCSLLTEPFVEELALRLVRLVDKRKIRTSLLPGEKVGLWLSFLAASSSKLSDTRPSLKALVWKAAETFFPTTLFVASAAPPQRQQETEEGEGDDETEARPRVRRRRVEVVAAAQQAREDAEELLLKLRAQLG